MKLKEFADQISAGEGSCYESLVDTGAYVEL